MGPLRGDGNDFKIFITKIVYSREDGSPSWGRKQYISFSSISKLQVEKMGPLRGDGNNVFGNLMSTSFW